MLVEPTALPGVVAVTPRSFADERGWFTESFNQRALDEALGIEARFVQDNHSMSSKGVLRGLHYQLPPRAQGKLVRVLRGAVLDVVVDVRRSSPHFGRSVAVELSESNRRQLWIPEGHAHGFLSLVDFTEVLYKTTDFWAPGLERAIRWDDPAVALPWPRGLVPRLSAKDASAPLLADAELVA